MLGANVRLCGGRLGPRVGGFHGRGDSSSSVNGFLHLLRERAVGRCFNCFARDHRIASCRDPPRCVLCSKSGHKARFCPAPDPARRATAWVRHAPAPDAAVPAPGSDRVVPEMNPIPGDQDMRPPRVSAAAARTSKLREAKRELLLHGLVAVQRDAWVLLTCDEVHRDVLQQLRIPAQALKVSKISTTLFLLRFETPEMRNAAHAKRSLAAGRISLHLMPWGRQVRATKRDFFYRARICIEGVPDHAHQVESVLHLLPKQSFVEGIDFTRKRDEEKGCFILWIWCNDPFALAVQGDLQIEEPVELPEEYYGSVEFPVLRAEAMSVFVYDVIIHLDRVEDYSPPPSSPSNESYESDTSGIPSDVNMVQWPAWHNFLWHLGQPDVLPDPPRRSVYDRIGHRRDRSPPRGGGSEGLRQMPPPNKFDFARPGFGGPGPSSRWGHGSGGSDYQHRQWGQREGIHRNTGSLLDA
ncbi:unnamed protein product [Urochloa decumbens]|uniref:CCHC-type domain-containing protein n=1 Tax=Urochloa decumbens TaxID=240449 RepID=A0ABC8Y3C0_9POAL